MPDAFAMLLLGREKNMLDVTVITPSIPLNKFMRKEALLDPSLCHVIRTGTEFTVRDINKDVSCECLLYKMDEGGYACIPMIVGGTTAGVVTIIMKAHCYGKTK